VFSWHSQSRVSTFHSWRPTMGPSDPSLYSEKPLESTSHVHCLHGALPQKTRKKLSTHTSKEVHIPAVYHSKSQVYRVVPHTLGSKTRPTCWLRRSVVGSTMMFLSVFLHCTWIGASMSLKMYTDATQLAVLADAITTRNTRRAKTGSRLT
jgi:hypothetical protein